METLSSKEIDSALAKLPGWKVEQGRLQCDLVFENFIEAFGFMTAVAIESEAMNHHPDWSNSYNKVCIKLITHSKGRLTEKDLELAERIEKLSKKYSPK